MFIIKIVFYIYTKLYMSEDMKIPRKELMKISKIWKVTDEHLKSTGDNIFSILKNINISNNNQTLTHLKVINESNRNIQLNILLDQIESLKKDYPIINLFNGKEQQIFIDDIVNWRKDNLLKRINDYLILAQWREEEKDLWKWRYKDLIEADPTLLLKPIFEQITLLFADTEELTKFTDKTKVYWKTLFKKCWLSPFVLNDTRKIDEYHWYKNISRGLQYFLAWLNNDKKTFYAWEGTIKYRLPCSFKWKIEEITLVNKYFWDFWTNNKNQNENIELKRKNNKKKIEETRWSALSVEVATDFVEKYLSTAHVFSEPWYEKRSNSLGEEDKKIIPTRLSSLMRPIIKDRRWTCIINNLKYYKAIRENDKETQKIIEDTILKDLVSKNNDYGNIRGIIIYKKIIDDWLLKDLSIGKILENTPYAAVSDMVHNAIQTAYKYYVWSLEEISMIPFVDAINKRYNEIQVHNNGAFRKASLEINKRLSSHK